MLKTGNRLQKNQAPCLAPLRLVEAKRSGQRAISTVPVNTGSPWKMYTMIYDLKLGEHEPFVVTEKRGGRFDLVAVP